MDIPDKELRDVMRFTKAKTKREAMARGRRARAKGITAPAADVLIAAWAVNHGVKLVPADKQMEALLKL